MIDHRRAPRVAVDWKVSLHQGKEVTHGRAIQFSEYGMLVTPPEVAEVGKRYELLFTLPGHRSSLRIKGIVVYTTDKGAGIRFEQVPPEISATLRSQFTSLNLPPV